MNEIINNLKKKNGDKFMSEMHLRRSRFTYSPCKLINENLSWPMEILKIHVEEQLQIKC